MKSLEEINTECRALLERLESGKINFELTTAVTDIVKLLVELTDAEAVFHKPIPQQITATRKAGRKQLPLEDCAPSTQYRKLREINQVRIANNMLPFQTIQEAIAAQRATGITERLRAPQATVAPTPDNGTQSDNSATRSQVDNQSLEAPDFGDFC